MYVLKGLMYHHKLSSGQQYVRLLLLKPELCMKLLLHLMQLQDPLHHLQVLRFCLRIHPVLSLLIYHKCYLHQLIQILLLHVLSS